MSFRPAIFLTLLFFCRPAFSRGGGGCFEQGTPVLVPGGVKAVDSIKPGDAVRLPGTSSFAASVYSVEPGEYVELKAGPLSVRVTSAHPFAVKPGVYKEAASLKPGDILLTFENGCASSRTVSSILRVKSARPAYNLLVFPGGEYVAGGFVVHNKGCFLPDTPILRADGTTAAISALRPGETLLAFNPDGTVTRAKVLEIIRREAESYYELKTTFVTLRATAEHPFYAGNGEFRTLKALKPGSVIYAYDGAGGLKPQEIVSIKEFPGRITVYNLRVDKPNTYFANFIAVHNKGGGCFPAGAAVMTPSGTSPIEKLSPGDPVTAFENGRLKTAAVTALIKTEGIPYTILTAAGKTLATAEHPFLTRAGYIKAADLKPGMETGFVSGGRTGWTTVQSVKALTVAVPVYNLSVDGPNTFIADGFMVHNKGGGYGGHGGSSGPLDDLYTALFLMLALYSVFAKKGGDESGELDIIISRSRIRAKAERTASLLGFLSKQDKTLAPDVLVARVKEVFLKLQECWTARDCSPMNTMIMPHLLAMHSAQLEGMKHDHEIDLVENIEISAIDLVHVNYVLKPDSRTFTALITACAADYYIDDRDSSFLRGNREPAGFQEFWTFRQQGDAWLLDEIEQTAESDKLSREDFVEQFTDDQVSQITGTEAPLPRVIGPDANPLAVEKGAKIGRMLNFLAVSDQMWSKDRMELAASLAFTNVYMAWEAGDPKELQPDYILPEAMQKLTEMFARQKAAGLSFEFRNFCVRKVELALVTNRAGGGDGSHPALNSRGTEGQDSSAIMPSSGDEFTARITAHAQRAVVQNGADVRREKYVTPFTEFWVFGKDGEHWKLKELLERESGLATLGAENVDEDSSPAQLEWYYTKKRA